MASSSSSNPSSTSSSSTTSTPSAARVLSDSERVRPRLPNPAAAPAANAALGVVPGANAFATAPGVATGAISSATVPGVAPSSIASASAPNVAPEAIASPSAPGVSRSIKRPPTYTPTAWGGSKGVPPPTYFAHAHQRGRGGRARNSAGVSQPWNSVGVSQHVSRKPSQERGWQTAADPTSTFAPSRLSSEGSSPSTSAWSKPLPYIGITLVPNASGSAPAVATSADTAPEPDASTSSAPGVTTIADLALEADVLTSASSSTPGVTTIVSASTPSSVPGVTTIADSATTSAPGAAPTIPSLRDNWVAVHWGIVPRSVEHCPGQQVFGGKSGNGMPPVEALYPDPLCAWREQVPPRSFGAPLCWECRLRPARVEARPCGHLAICVLCYCYANSNRFVCPFCGLPITWLL
ncbi:flocculation protein FLO11-like [Miscanthus floridulus]|uniref:flocculation protein FLO11-like n=1 Tax=Miscanthus floridulus TaxID=154761 RepID=UPI003457A265